VKTINIKALFRFEGYILKQLITDGNSVEIKIDYDGRIKPRCPHCNGKLRRNKTGKGLAMDLPLGCANVVYISYPRVQDKCENCQTYVTTRPREIHPTKNVTWRLMKAVSTWIDAAPISSVGDMFSISESTAKRYDQAYLEEYCPETELNSLRALLIDEKHLGKHGYITIILNADTGELLHFEKGKKKETLDSFFNKLTTQQKSSIEVVGIDRAGSYLSSVEENLPGSAIVFDRFHIIQNINQAIDEVRRNAVAKASKDDKKVIKGSRYLLLSNPSDLTESGRAKLENLIEVNQEISIAYLLKEQFQRVYQRPTKMWAMDELEEWCDLAASSGIKAFERLSRSFRRGAEMITNYAKYRLTSGRIEGFNSLISKLVSKARGIKDISYMKLRLRYGSIMSI
jgi:transposase